MKNIVVARCPVNIALAIVNRLEPPGNQYDRGFQITADLEPVHTGTGMAAVVLTFTRGRPSQEVIGNVQRYVNGYLEGWADFAHPSSPQSVVDNLVEMLKPLRAPSVDPDEHGYVPDIDGDVRDAVRKALTTLGVYDAHGCPLCLS